MYLKKQEIKCGQFSKSFKISQKLTALLYFNRGKLYINQQEILAERQLLQLQLLK